MDNVEREKNNANYVFPQLTRFNAVKISSERLLIASGMPIQSKVQEEIVLRVEADPEPGEDIDPSGSKIRVLVFITFDGKWRKKESEEAVATFYATYRSSFTFKEDTSIELVRACASTKLYRDFLVAQAYPLAKSHMMSELRMMGINTPRDLGYDVNVGEYIEQPVPKPAKTAPRRKKKPALPSD